MFSKHSQNICIWKNNQGVCSPKCWGKIIKWVCKEQIKTLLFQMLWCLCHLSWLIISFLIPNDFHIQFCILFLTESRPNCISFHIFPRFPLTMRYACVLSHSVVSDSFWPYGLQPARFLCPWNFPGKNTGVGCHALLQGISPAEVSS